jgi:hypothetical protein
MKTKIERLKNAIKQLKVKMKIKIKRLKSGDVEFVAMLLIRVKRFLKVRLQCPFGVRALRGWGFNEIAQKTGD